MVGGEGVEPSASTLSRLHSSDELTAHYFDFKIAKAFSTLIRES